MLQLLRDTILLSSEVFNTNLLDLGQPLPKFARKRSTEGVRLCKGTKGCGLKGKYPWRDLVRTLGRIFGRVFIVGSFVALPPVSLQKQILQEICAKIRTKYRTQVIPTKDPCKRNPHNKKQIGTKEKSHKKIRTQNFARPCDSEWFPHDLSQLEP